MANEVEWSYLSQVTLEANGASAAANAFAAADDASLSAANHGDFPYADLVLSCGFGAAVSAGFAVNVYRRDLDIDGTNDGPEPSTGYKALFIGSFVIPAGASAVAYYPLTNVPLSKACSFYVENGTNQTLSAGWTLKATPKTYAPGS